MFTSDSCSTTSVAKPFVTENHAIENVSTMLLRLSLSGRG